MIAREYVAAGACTRRVIAIVGVTESTFYYSGVSRKRMPSFRSHVPKPL